MKAWLPSVLLTAVTCLCYHWRDDIRHHLLGKDTFITSSRIREEAAGLIFRGLPPEEVRATAMKQLQTSATLHAARLQDSSFTPHFATHLEDEIRAWQRQWDKEEERRQRLEGQRLTEPAMADEIAAALLDRAWIEEQIQAKTRVTEVDLKAAWQARKDSHPLPQMHRVSHLFLSRHGPGKGNRLAEIQTIQRKLQTGVEWRELAQKYSEDPRTKHLSGHLGWLSMERIPEAFATTLIKLQPGQTSGPIETALGWHLIRLEERRPSRALTFEETRPELEALLAWRKRQIAMDKLLERLTTQTQKTER